MSNFDVLENLLENPMGRVDVRLEVEKLGALMFRLGGTISQCPYQPSVLLGQDGEMFFAEKAWLNGYDSLAEDVMLGFIKGKRLNT